MNSSATAQKFFGFNLHRHAKRHLRDHFIPHEGNNYHPHVLRHRALFFYSLLLILVKTVMLAGPLLVPYAPAESSAITSENIISLTNQSRKDSNLPELVSSPKLAVAAANKARDMMSKEYFAHFSPEGVSPWYWIKSAGYDYAYAGENLAIRFSTAEGVNEAWLTSPAHRANILSKDFQEIGVAAVTDNFGKEGVITLVVQLFGTQAKSGGDSAARQKNPQPFSIVKKVTDATSSENEKIGRPEILFPLNSSFVNKSRFEILGRAPEGSAVELYLDGKLLDKAAISADRTFAYYPPEEKAAADGNHSLYARAKGANNQASPKSDEIKFKVDTVSPQIKSDVFSILPKSGHENEYTVKASVSDDSIRTIVSVGSDSAVLERNSNSEWQGEIKLANFKKGQNLPIEIFSQDLAGNEARLRVGWLSNGDVRGIFSAAGGTEAKPVRFSVLGLFAIPDFGKFSVNFYLLFLIFICGSLILMIGIKRHIQHPRVIAAASTVAMLAVILVVV